MNHIFLMDSSVEGHLGSYWLYHGTRERTPLMSKHEDLRSVSSSPVKSMARSGAICASDIRHFTGGSVELAHWQASLAEWTGCRFVGWSWLRKQDRTTRKMPDVYLVSPCSSTLKHICRNVHKTYTLTLKLS